MQNNARDRGLGILFSLFGLGVFLLSFSVKKRTVLTIGPGFMPRIIGAVLLLLGVVLTIQAVRTQAPPPSSKPQDRRAPVLVTLLLLILYVAFLEVLGFTLTTACYLTLQFAVLAKDRTWKRLSIYGLASVGGSLVITVIFSRFLRLYLPQGIFQ